MCNLDLEHLISDSNRSIATLAITTLLKTGNEGSIERLMKQIQSFMSEIPDEFKIIVVKAIQSLCFKFPNKHDVMINLCSTMLREEVRASVFNLNNLICYSNLNILSSLLFTSADCFVHYFFVQFFDQRENYFISSLTYYPTGRLPVQRSDSEHYNCSVGG